MTAALAPITALLFSVALLLMGNGLLGTLLPVRAQLELFSTFDIGILGSSYFVGFAGGCYFGPHLVRRVGHIRAFTAMVSLASAVALAHALVVDPLFWWPLRALSGSCFAILYMIIESWLSEKSTNENRGFVFSIYTIINLTVITLGQMMLTLGNPTAFPLFSVASILVSLAALPVALTNAPAPAPVVTVHIRIRHLSRTSPVGFAGALAVGLANGAFWSLGPVFAQNNIFAVGTTGIALFMSTAVMAGAAGQWPLGHLSDRVDRRKVIVVVCVGAALSGIGMSAFADVWQPAIFVFSALFGFFSFPLYALCAAHTNDAVESGGFVEAASGLLLIYAAGAVAGPLIASTAMRLGGPSGLFVYMASVQAVMAVFVLHRLRKYSRPPEDKREPFTDSLRIVQTVSSVDPQDPHDESNFEG